jgi:hypothetical protein
MTEDATEESPALAAPRDIIALLADPAAASAIGLCLGTALALAAWSGVRLITPADPMLGLVRAGVVNFLGMLVGLGGLAFFFFFARASLGYFGGGVVTSFVVTAIVRFLRATRAQAAH